MRFNIYFELNSILFLFFVLFTGYTDRTFIMPYGFDLFILFCVKNQIADASSALDETVDYIVFFLRSE